MMKEDLYERMQFRFSGNNASFNISRNVINKNTVHKKQLDSKLFSEGLLRYNYILISSIL